MATKPPTRPLFHIVWPWSSHMSDGSTFLCRTSKISAASSNPPKSSNSRPGNYSHHRGDHSIGFCSAGNNVGDKKQHPGTHLWLKKSCWLSRFFWENKGHRPRISMHAFCCGSTSSAGWKQKSQMGLVSFWSQSCWEQVPNLCIQYHPVLTTKTHN